MYRYLYFKLMYDYFVNTVNVKIIVMLKHIQGGSQYKHA